MNVYDFDGTIYDGDSSIDFFLYALKRNHKILLYAPKQLFGFVLYTLKKINKTELKEYFFSFLSCIDAENMIEDFWELNQIKIYSWYLKQKKTDDIIISASPEVLLRPICRKLNLENLIASKVDIHSGKFTGENCRGEEKVKRLEEEFSVTQIDCFYSDSLSDLPLAKLASKAYLINRGTISEWNFK